MQEGGGVETHRVTEGIHVRVAVFVLSAGENLLFQLISCECLADTGADVRHVVLTEAGESAVEVSVSEIVVEQDDIRTEFCNPPCEISRETPELRV